MKRSLIAALTVLLVFGSTMVFVAPVTNARAADKKHPDKIKATKHAEGTLAGFEVGDYYHAILKPAKGEDLGFYIGPSEALRYFLVAHQNQKVKVTYQVMDSWIEEAGGYTEIEQLSAAETTDGITHTAWWTAERKKASLAKLRKKYDALMEKATKYD